MRRFVLLAGVIILLILIVGPIWRNHIQSGDLPAGLDDLLIFFMSTSVLTVLILKDLFTSPRRILIAFLAILIPALAVILII